MMRFLIISSLLIFSLPSQASIIIRLCNTPIMFIYNDWHVSIPEIRNNPNYATVIKQIIEHEKEKGIEPTVIDLDLDLGFQCKSA